MSGSLLSAGGAGEGQQQAMERLLDANLDRAREGLRVLEDWCRFVLHRPDLVSRLKDLRQRLGCSHRLAYKLARDAATDVAAGFTHPAQRERHDPLAVVAANAARVQEALRVLEEFGRTLDPPLAEEAARIRYAVYDLEVECLRGGSPEGLSRRERLAQCSLYLITSPVPNLEGVVEAALTAGVRLVQYRPKQDPATDVERLRQARTLRQMCHRHGALFLVNDRLDLALAAEADGVHLGQSDLPVAEARQLLGPERLLGRSTHAPDQLRQAVQEGCDYVGVGPVHSTPSKPGRPSVGLAYVTTAAADCPIPWFAIGGIEAANLAAVQQAGAQRVAVIRAITEAADPGAATLRLLQELGAR